jgi:uncharacterized protein YlaI
MFRAAFNEKVNTNLSLYTYLINDCNTSLAKDAIHRVSTTGETLATRWLMNRLSKNGLFVTFFFQIGITYSVLLSVCPF